MRILYSFAVAEDEVAAPVSIIVDGDVVPAGDVVFATR